MPIQQMLLGAGGADATNTYVDDVFSTFLYQGTGSAVSVNNGIDLSGEGGLVWFKGRTTGFWNSLVDTARGASKAIFSNHHMAEDTGVNGYMTSFNNNGFTTGNYGNTSYNGTDFASWTFRKAKGFFDVVTWTGNGTAGRQISHNLGCVPGMVAIKCTSDSHNWTVWHRGLSSNAKTIQLNDNGAEFTADDFNGAAPSSTVIHLSSTNNSNGNGKTYVAYLWGGGESPAATARSVDFDGNGDDLRWASSADFAMGTGDFTFECWVKPSNWSSTYMTVFCVGSGSNTGGLWIGKNQSNFVVRSYSVADYIQTTDFPPLGQWTHVAATRSGTTLKLFYNGIEQKSVTNSYDFQGGDDIWVSNDAYNNRFVGKISNLRLVKGTAVYTSPFRPPTEPLTNITNTKLLCCNNSSTTGSTVTPGTITANGDPTASSDSPFDDPAGFVFGENGDQGIIKCGVFEGDDNNTHLHHLGWEPQWILHKRFDGGNSDWQFKDTMRGWGETGFYRGLRANTTDTEETSLTDKSSPKATGFDFDPWYSTGEKVIYIAIRRPDGYVGKPPELGTDVFNMGVGQNSTTIPNYISGFPVDMGMHRLSAATSSFTLITRLMGPKYLLTPSNAAEGDGSWATFDSNTGYITNQQNNTHQAWMWKRHAGFDVVAYKGTEVAGQAIAHSMNAVPEMMWVKRRSGSAEGWAVYHKGLNGGSSPEDWNLKLDETAAQEDTESRWNDTAPTSTHFFLGDSGRVNTEDEDYIAMLFASVDGISKVGYYSGQATELTITTGFAPRFLILKRINGADNWWVFDTTRGWASGNNSKLLQLDSSAAESTQNFGAPTSTGFTLIGDSTRINAAGNNYIYYAHA